MTPDDWKLVKSVLDRAMAQPLAERTRWLDAQLPDEPELRAEVVSLLAAYDAGRTLLEPASPAAAQAESAHHAGDRIGPYELVREVGRGGMGVVYVAERADDSFEQTVALKLVQTGLDPAEMERRFLQERQILARLEHPNIARLLDGGRTAGGLHYLAMEYVEGEPIDAYCAARDLDLDARLDLFLAICSAVDYAHRNLVVHRDLKPGNVLVTADGTPKLLDFGIAKLLQAEALGRTIQPTRVGLRVMTPDYASPEQMLGEAVTTASDVYSLGVLLYRLVTGRMPYELKGRPLPEVARVICEEPVRPPSTAARQVAEGESTALVDVRQAPRRLRGDLDAIVLKALRKQPADRYATAEQLAADLRRLRGGRPVLARHGSLGYRASKFVLRHRFGVAVAAGFALLLLLFVLSLTRQVARTTRALERAESETAKAAAVREFLEQTLDAANPQSNEGRELTVQEALDRAGERLGTSFAGQPEIDAAVQNLVGRLYSNMGRYEDAEPLLRQALATRRGLYDASAEDDRATGEDLAQSLSDLGLLLGRIGKADEAEPLLRDALAMRQQVHGENHPSVAHNLDLLARVARGDGQYRQAADLERQAVAIYRATLGERDAEVVHALSSLAEFEKEAGDLDAAEAALREAAGVLDALAAAGDPASAVRAEVAMDLGELYEARARYAEAEAQYVEASDIMNRVFGAEHHWRAQALVRIGTIRARLGRFDEGEAALAEGTDILRRLLGPDHPDVAVAVSNLAFLYGEAGRLEQAVARMREVEEIQRRTIPGHPALGVTLRNLGLLEIRQGSLAGARAHLQEALAIHLEILGEEHPRTALSRQALGWALGESGDWQRAESLLRQAIEGIDTTYGEDHPRAAEARSLLGLALLRLGRKDEAEPLLEAALPVLLEAHGENNYRVVRARAALDELDAGVGP